MSKEKLIRIARILWENLTKDKMTPRQKAVFLTIIFFLFAAWVIVSVLDAIPRGPGN